MDWQSRSIWQGRPLLHFNGWHSTTWWAEKCPGWCDFCVLEPILLQNWFSCSSRPHVHSLSKRKKCQKSRKGDKTKVLVPPCFPDPSEGSLSDHMISLYNKMHAQVMSEVNGFIRQAAFSSPSAVRSALNGIMSYPLLADRVSLNAAVAADIFSLLPTV